MIVKVKTDKKTKVLFNFNFKNIEKIAKKYNKLVLVVDHNVYNYHSSRFSQMEHVIIMEGGENTKTLVEAQEIIDKILASFIELVLLISIVNSPSFGLGKIESEFDITLHDTKSSS